MVRLGFRVVLGTALAVGLVSITEAEDVIEQAVPPEAESYPAWEVERETDRPATPLDLIQLPPGSHQPFGMPMAWWSQPDWRLETQEEQSTLWVDDQPADSEVRWEAETASYIEELAAIRRQVGVDPLERTWLDDTISESSARAEESFRQAVLTVVNDQSIPPQASSYSSASPSEWQDRSIPDLRAAACGLEAQANCLEEVDQFALADEIRELAKKLRLTARSHSAESSGFPPR